MNKRLELTGQTFGQLTVQWFSHIGPGGSYWNCKCECGTVKVVAANALTRGKTVSCGCHKRRLTRERSITHNMSRHRAYASWKAMHQRCTHQQHPDYHRYGGRGVSIHPAWHTFEGFWADMGPSWRVDLTLDRIDPDGNYEPDNCRWATRKQQSRNRRNNHVIDTPLGPMAIAEAADRFKLTPKVIAQRIATGRKPEEILAPLHSLPRRSGAS